MLQVQPGYTYIVATTDNRFIKIGFTGRVLSRWYQVRTESTKKYGALRHLGYFPSDSSRDLELRIAVSRITNPANYMAKDWFVRNSRVDELIASFSLLPVPSWSEDRLKYGIGLGSYS